MQYTGSVQVFTAPVDGVYRIDCWGCTGDWGWDGGGHTWGLFEVTQGTKLYVYVGDSGHDKNGGNEGGWNGGGDGEGHDPNMQEGSGSGGGATDVRTMSGNWNQNLTSRIIVAGGAGGGSHYHNGGDGGGWTGGSYSSASGGTQTSGYAFGRGQSYGRAWCGGGGGGWYGGYGLNGTLAGAGGSSYVSGISGGQVYTTYRAKSGGTITGANALGAAGRKGTDLPKEIVQLGGYSYPGGSGGARFKLQ